MCSMGEAIEGSNYAKGSLQLSDRDWFHDTLSRIEAEQVLKSSSSQHCFLLRRNEGGLVVSIQHGGEYYHLKINYNPGWYQLEIPSRQKFTELDDLISHYYVNTISDELNFTLGVTCKSKKSDERFQSNSAIYEVGSVFCLNKDWYHGKMTRFEAEKRLRSLGYNAFLIRWSNKEFLVLSIICDHNFCHIKIIHGPGGYELESTSSSDNKSFSELDDLISYYSKNVVTIGCHSATLGVLLAHDKSKTNTEDALKLQDLYSKGEPADLTRHGWYHGEITEEQAVVQLKSKKKNAYLVRQTANDLILSLKTSHTISHLQISRTPEGYELEGRKKKFPTVPDMISYYMIDCVGVVKVYRETSDSHQNYYSKGEPADLTRHGWYHGEMTKEQAVEQLKTMKKDAFLVHQTTSDLILSSHTISQLKISRTPEGYGLEGRDKIFPTVSDMIAYYKQFPIDDTTVLGANVYGDNSRGKEAPDTHQETNGDFQQESNNVIRRGDTRQESNGDNQKEDEDIRKEHNGDIRQESPHHYFRGQPEDLIEYEWYHGRGTEEDANISLSTASNNQFLVRQDTNDLILSMKIRGWSHHVVIHRSPEGYQLDERSEIFATVPMMISYYMRYPIRNDQILAGAAQKSCKSLWTLNTGQVFKKTEKMQKLNWRKCADLDIPISSPQIVKIGESVYVGGGMTRGECPIFEYNMSKDTWSSLPQCPTIQHGLAVVNNKLIAVGGRYPSESVAINSVYTLESKWIKVIQQMPTSRYLLSTISHENKYVIAIGGYTYIMSNGENVSTDRVEIYSHPHGKWFSTKRLPFPTAAPSTSSIGDKYFLLGTVAEKCNIYTTVYDTLNSLIDNAIPANSIHATHQGFTTWGQLKAKHPLTQTSLVEMNGKLYAMGGSLDFHVRHGTRFISTYDFDTDTWVECKDAELPIPLYKLGVVKLQKTKVMIIGGQSKMQTLSSAVYIGSYNKINTELAVLYS